MSGTDNPLLRGFPKRQTGVLPDFAERVALGNEAVAERSAKLTSAFHVDAPRRPKQQSYQPGPAFDQVGYQQTAAQDQSQRIEQRRLADEAMQAAAVQTPSPEPVLQVEPIEVSAEESTRRASMRFRLRKEYNA